MYVLKRPKLTVPEQIEYLKKEKGIRFEIMNESSAKDFLENHNYLFKLKAYAKNYEKYNTTDKRGQYVNLDFAFLVELSKIDMIFRQIILRMSMDVEHFLKIQLLKEFNDNPNENGYTIIEELFQKKSYIKENIKKANKYSACYELVDKYINNMAIWNIVEVITFGDFIKLYSLYFEKYESQNDCTNFLWSVKFLRNAAAHNNCLLNSLRKPYKKEKNFTKNNFICRYISTIPNIGTDTLSKKMSNPVIHDFVVLLYLFNKVVGDSVRRKTMDDLYEFINIRMIRHREYFEKDSLFVSHYNFLKIIVDFFHAM